MVMINGEGDLGASKVTAEVSRTTGWCCLEDGQGGPSPVAEPRVAKDATRIVTLSEGQLVHDGAAWQSGRLKRCQARRQRA